MNISLLPPALRAQINRRLENGEADASILAWLQSLPEVPAAAAGPSGHPVNLDGGAAAPPYRADSAPDGHAVSQDDLTAWKQGGCRSDRSRAAAIQTFQSLAAHVGELKQAVPAPLGDQLAACLAGDLAEAWMRPNPNPAAPADPLKRVKELSPLVAVLRRGDQAAERLEIRRDWLRLVSQIHQDRLAAKKAKTGQFPRFPNPDGGISEETIAKIERELNLF